MKPLTKYERAKIQRRQKVLNMLNSKPHCQASFIANYLGWELTRPAVRRILTDMVDTGELREEGKSPIKYSALVKKTKDFDRLAEEVANEAQEAADEEGHEYHGAEDVYINGRLVHKRSGRKPIKNPDAIGSGYPGYRRSDFRENV